MASIQEIEVQAQAFRERPEAYLPLEAVERSVAHAEEFKIKCP